MRYTCTETSRCSSTQVHLPLSVQLLYEQAARIYLRSRRARVVKGLLQNTPLRNANTGAQKPCAGSAKGDEGTQVPEQLLAQWVRVNIVQKKGRLQREGRLPFGFPPKNGYTLNTHVHKNTWVFLQIQEPQPKWADSLVSLHTKSRFRLRRRGDGQRFHQAGAE